MADLSTAFLAELQRRQVTAPPAPARRSSRGDIFKGTSVPVDPSASNSEILQSIGCNFDVLSVPPSHNGRTYDECRLWLRSDNGDLLGSFGNRRRAIQPGDFLEYFREFCRQSERAITLDRVGTPNHGRTFYMASQLDSPGKLPADQRTVGDVTESWLVLTDYYGESRRPRAYVLFNELVCTNGMTRRVRDSLCSLSHLRTQGQAEVSQTLEAALSEVDAYQRLKLRAQETRITMDTARRALREFFGDPDAEGKKVRRLEAIYESEMIGGELPERYSNAWRLINTVTQYASHNGMSDTQASRGRAFDSQISGARARDVERFTAYVADRLALV